MSCICSFKRHIKEKHFYLTCENLYLFINGNKISAIFDIIVVFNIIVILKKPSLSVRKACSFARDKVACFKEDTSKGRGLTRVDTPTGTMYFKY